MSDLAETLKQGTLDDALAAVNQVKQGPAPSIIAYRADELANVVFPPRRPILQRDGQVFFGAGEIWEVFATRGFGKTWFLMTIALMVSSGKGQIGFTAPERRRVLYVDGEMARHDIQDRYRELCDRTGLIMTDHLVIVAADWQDDFLPRIDTEKGQRALEPFVTAADVVIFDNRSCLFDSEGEKDPSAWQPAQDYLLSLRRLGKATILAHHANRQGGARGLGKPEDAMNIVMKLSHPDNYKAEEGARFVCDCTPPDGKLRSVYGRAASPFGVRLTDKGWVMEAAGRDPSETAIREKLVNYLKLAEAAKDSPKSFNQAFKNIGGNRQMVLKMWGEMLQAGEIVGDKKTGFKVGVLPSAVP